MVSRRPAQCVAAVAFALAHMCIAKATNAGTAFVLCVPAALLLFYGGAGFSDVSGDEVRRPTGHCPHTCACRRPLTSFCMLPSHSVHMGTWWISLAAARQWLDAAAIGDAAAA